MVTDNHLFESLGLTPLQADVLVGLMENGGSASVPEIISILSENQKVNRTSIYSVLKKLERMNLVLSSEQSDSRGITYTLTSNSPDELTRLLREPHKEAINKFTERLRKAKMIASKTNIETEFYSLNNLDQIKGQINGVIKESESYILIMANSPMLVLLKPIIESKLKHHPNIVILIQPTWNPDEGIIFDDLLNEYQELIGTRCIANPLNIFSDIIEITSPIITDFERRKDFGEIKIVELMKKIHFVQVLTDKGIVMSTYIDHTKLLSQIGSGFYSKEQFLSQNFIIIFLSIFKTHQSDFDIQIMEKVVSNRMANWFTVLKNMLN